jgi:hypothetical protein
MQQDSLADAQAFKAPSKVPLVVTAIAGVLGGALIGALVTAATMGGDEKGKKRGGRKEQPVAEAPVSASASGSAAASGSMAIPVAEKGSLAERAEKGDPAAMKQLEGMPPGKRSSVETFALAEARAIAKRKEIAELARKIGLVPKLVKEDKDVKNRIGELLDDREVAPDLLRAYANLPGDTGPTLLYAIVTGPKKAGTSELAEEVLYSKDVRSKASLGLLVAMDLRKVEKCEELPKLLEKAKVDGDRRSLTPIMRFHQKRGCGEKKLDDCWPCIREGDLLKDATVALQKRTPP